MARYLEQLNECTDPVAGDYLPIYDASAGATDKDRKVDAKRIFGEAWQSPSWGSGWTNYGSGYQVVQFRRINNEIEIRGYAGTNLASPATTIFTLPAGYRPAATLIFERSGYPGNVRAMVDISITSAGLVTTAGSGFTFGNSQWLNLNGIRFWLD